MVIFVSENNNGTNIIKTNNMKRINYYTISRSDVMKLAWKWFKQFNGKMVSKFVEGYGYVWSKMEVSFSKCLKDAWSFYKEKAEDENKRVDWFYKFIDNNKHKGGIFA